jgi:hypothetical protein
MEPSVSSAFFPPRFDTQARYNSKYVTHDYGFCKRKKWPPVLEGLETIED